jgi:signal peptide peptidase SppA
MDEHALKNFIAAGPPDPSEETTDALTIPSGSDVAVIPIVGPIEKYKSIFSCGTSTIDVQAQLETALSDSTIASIVLYIDSPGGTMAGTTDLADYIASAKSIKPIIAYVSDHCASAAYWIASQCTAIYANAGAFVGSIGVYIVMVDSSVAANQAGYSVKLVAAGEYKGIGVDGVPIDDKAIASVQRSVNAAYDLFTNAVSRGRSLPLADVITLADGEVHIAKEAMSLNLIDGIGTLDAVFNHQKETINMSNDKLALKADDSTDTAAPVQQSDSDILKQILASIASLTEEIKKLNSASDDDASTDTSDDSDSTDSSSDQVADDNTDASAKAVSADRDRLKAISEAVGANRADYALTSFLAGKSALEAKAGLTDLLNAEVDALKKAHKQANAFDGIDPIKLEGTTTVNADEAQQLWDRNEGDVQKTYSGKKEYFLANYKHSKKLAQAKA